MAKTTYMYRVSMGRGKIDEISYCYARNSKTAREAYRELNKDKKYDTFEITMFGEALFAKHPEPFSLMPSDEIAYITQQKLAQEQAYAQRKAQPVEFVPVESEVQ